MTPDVTIIAGGDSLRGFPFEKIRGEIYAINYAGVFLPRFDRLCGLDGKRKDYPEGPFETVVGHGGRWRMKGQKINREPGFVGNINHSVFFAVNVAIQEGAKDIVILGADQRGNRHWYDSEDHFSVYPFDRYDRFFETMSRFVAEDESIILVESACPHLPVLSLKNYLELL